MYRRIWRLALPAMAEQLVATLSQLIDMVMVGWLGVQAVAAVGLSSPPLWLLMALVVGLGTGTGAVVSRYAGAHDWDGLEEATRKTVLMATVIALVAGFVLFVWARPIVIWMRTARDVVPMATQFMRAMAPGMGAVAWALMVAAALRAGGDTRTPAWLSAWVIVLNVTGNYVLIYGLFGLPALGLLGVGIATSGARCLGVLALLVILIRRKQGVRVDWRRLLPGSALGAPAPRRTAAALQIAAAVDQTGWSGLQRGVLWRSLRLGVPAAVERGASVMAMLIYTKLVAGLGTVAVAAHYITQSAESVAYLVSMGVAAAAGTLVGQELGAGSPEKADQYGMATLPVGAAVGGVFAVFFLVLPHGYLSIFTGDPVVLQQGVVALRIAALAEIPMALTMVLMGALQGAGERAAPVFTTLVGAWFVRLTLTFLLLPQMGLAGAWLASAADWSVRLGLSWWRYRQGAWQRLRV